LNQGLISLEFARGWEAIQMRVTSGDTAPGARMPAMARLLLGGTPGDRGRNMRAGWSADEARTKELKVVNEEKEGRE